MKRYLIITVLLLVGLSACRKKQPVPNIRAFQHGEYFYDLTISGNHYENAFSFVIRKRDQEYVQGKDINPKVYILQHLQYDVPELDGFRLFNFNLISYFSEITYSVYNAGLYVARGGGFLAPNHQRLIIPSFDYDIDQISIFLTCIGENVKVDIEKSLKLQVNGKDYEVYRMQLPKEFDCQNNRQHIIYVDKNYGIISYVVEDIETETLIYRLDFNHYEVFMKR